MPALKKIGAAALAAFGWTSGGAGAVTASYLQVAGGGGAGGAAFNATSGGGGGAGGYLTGTTSLNPTLSYTVVVGAGGAGGATGSNNGAQGSSSQFGTLTASVGGGYGANGGTTNGGSGGSGGGAAGAGTAGAGTSGQGNAGSAASGVGGLGAGGGAGAVGGTSVGTTGGTGGVGLASSISGTSTYYAGGGGGAGDVTGGSGGNGGGGAGRSGGGAGTSATANTGGGGGGAGGNGGSGAGGNGGSGIVIISYAGAQQFGGGIVTSVGGNTIHTFLTSGTLSPLASLSASYLIVAGGGGASIGGGGAGGLLSGSGVTIDTNSTYLVTVGAGGGGATSGSNSSFSMVATSAVGGGRGAGFNANGTTGGSGGGAATYFSASAFTGGAATSGQGFAGGNSALDVGGSNGGGGGGAGAVGSNGSAVGNGGNGGNGLTSSISGTSTYYAGGGGGAGQGGSQGTGGLGGGGTGSYTSGTNGTANTGGGGGGGISVYSGAGGSGIVIISYAGSTQQMAGGSVTIVGGNVIHTFTSSGYLTPLTYYSNSLRFRSSAAAYLNRTPTVAGNRQKFTWSGWIKRGYLGSGSGFLINAGVIVNGGVCNQDGFTLAGDQLQVNLGYTGSGYAGQVTTNAVFRDPAAWYHIVVAIDTTQAVAANRCFIYVNGVNQSYTVNTAITQNFSTQFNNTIIHNIGRLVPDGFGGAAYQYFDGYMSNVNWIDGQQLTANSFGAFNSYGVWQPINYGGSYGTNGFYLPFNANAQTYADYINGGSTGTQQSVTASGITAQGTNSFTTEFFYYCLGDTGSDQQIFDFGVNGYSILLAQGTKNIQVFNRITAGTIVAATGSQLTYNQWHHIAFVRNGSACSLYIDGVLAATGTDSTNFTSTTVSIGCRYAVNAGNWYPANGYMSNARVVNGTAVYTSNFIPSTTPLTAITNTLLLTLQNSTFVDNSTNAYTLTNNGSLSMKPAKALAISVFNDQSPQGNNWTPNNISGASGVTLDYMTDVPTLTSTTAANYCVVNPLARVYNANNQTADGNLKSYSTTADAIGYGTMAFPKSAGKWYAECTVNAISGTAYTNIRNIAALSPDQSYGSDGTITGTSSGATYTTGDVIGVAYDWTAQTVAWYKNGTLQGTTPSVSQTTDLTFANYIPNTSTSFYWNFGQQPWKYTPPSGFVALNTYNL